MDSKMIAVLVFFCTVCYIQAQMLIPTPISSSVSRTNCGCSKLCLSNSSTCVPGDAGECYFSSFQTSANNILFEVSGSTTGYVALGLSPSVSSAGKSMVFVCSTSISNAVYPSNGGTATGWYFNDQTVIGSIQSQVTGQRRRKRASTYPMQCTFLLPIQTLISYNTSATGPSGQLPFIVTILSGSISGTSLGSPTRMYNSKTTVDIMNAQASGACYSSGTYSQYGGGSFSGTGNSASGNSGTSGSNGNSGNSVRPSTGTHVLALLFGIVSLRFMTQQ